MHNVKGAHEEYFENKVCKSNSMCNFVMNHDEYCELPNSKWESNNEVVAFISFEHPYGTQICFVSMERIFYYYHLRLNMTHMTEMKYFHAMYGVESNSWHSKNCESNILSQSHRRVLWLIIREICIGIGYTMWEKKTLKQERWDNAIRYNL